MVTAKTGLPNLRETLAYLYEQGARTCEVQIDTEGAAVNVTLDVNGEPKAFTLYGDTALAAPENQWTSDN